jgi:hypothetical protein
MNDSNPGLPDGFPEREIDTETQHRVDQMVSDAEWATALATVMDGHIDQLRRETGPIRLDGIPPWSEVSGHEE